MVRVSVVSSGENPKLKELRQLLEAGTEGPWSCGEEIDGKFCHWYGEYGWYLVGPVGGPELEDSEQGKVDASLIVAAVNSLPGLIRALEGLLKLDPLIHSLGEECYCFFCGAEGPTPRLDDPFIHEDDCVWETARKELM